MPRIVAVAAASMLLLGGSAAAAPAPGAADPTYRNPISKGFADTFADPVVFRGHDGRWYSYGTSDPLREGEHTPHKVPMAVSDNKVASDWADFAIGVATAPTPTGPWTHSDTPAVAPRQAPGGGWWATIDPSEFTDADGRRYLYFGSYFGGVWVVSLSGDGLRAVGEPHRVAIDNRFEGSYVVRHGGYYYLFASSANCCAGPTTGYAVFAGRATSPLGPFTDADGVSLNTSRAGGTPVVAQNGNTWIGPGHNGIVTDLAGQDWFVYHAIDRRDPYLDEPYGVNERPMLLDRLDWIDGWPAVRGGAGPSEDAEASPVTDGPVHDGFDSGLDGWESVSGTWSVSSGTVTQSEPGTADRLLVADATVPDDVRAETDVRLGSGASAGGLAVRYRSPA